MEQPSNPDADRYATLSPFQLKDELIKWARDYTQQKSATHKFLDAGRGNPNWVATTPREAFFTLGQFALAESKRVWDEPDLGGMPHAAGIAERLRQFLRGAPGPAAAPGAELLRRALDYGALKLGFDPDAFVHELTDATIGDNYPTPDRMLVHTERIVQRYLAKSMCADRPPPGTFDLFAVEGGTAAMCYVFGSLMANRVLRRGDTIAVGTPIFTPYLEMPRLEEFSLRTIEVGQSEMASNGRHTWQYPDAELAKLEDPSVKAFFLVNPSNPASVAIRQSSIDRLVTLVRTRRPDLLLLTDDVYGTFVDGFRSLAADLPHNTILVYSFSKYFGCTGWRLGVVAMHEENVVDQAIARLPAADRQALHARYENLTLEPEKIKFIDRMVADSRDVALNHTAGLSLPQQAQMALFSLFALLDAGDAYQSRCRGIIKQRFETLFRGLDVPVIDDPLRAGYYADLDLEAWGRHTFGDDFIAYLEAHHDPLEIVLALAHKRGTVLLNGGGFDGPPWAARVSLANLDTEDYAAVGEDLKEVAERAVQLWKDRRGGNGNGNGGGNGHGNGGGRPRP
ncbi:MAG TPA: aspartate 4-decarboxylase [Polyangia bacterium]|nr:aspartate 4-decarboxylase [Polyangia bacterium]